MTAVVDERAAAREVYRESLAVAAPLTGRVLGDRFGKSERWGRDRIAEVKTAGPVEVEPVPAGSAGAAVAAAWSAAPSTRGRVLAWLALLLGVAASVGGNVGHTVLVVGGTDTPRIIGAAFWPVALVISVEVIARVEWPASPAYRVARFAGVGAVAAVAALISYRHMHGLLTYWGEEALSAAIGPLGVDGLVVLGALALLAIGRTRK